MGRIIIRLSRDAPAGSLRRKFMMLCELRPGVRRGDWELADHAAQEIIRDLAQRHALRRLHSNIPGSRRCSETSALLQECPTVCAVVAPRRELTTHREPPWSTSLQTMRQHIASGPWAAASSCLLLKTPRHKQGVLQ